MALPNYEFKSDFAKKHREEGRTMATRDALSAILRRSFGELPASAIERLNAADLPTLERWLEASLEASLPDRSLKASLEASLPERSLEALFNEK